MELFRAGNAQKDVAFQLQSALSHRTGANLTQNPLSAVREIELAGSLHAPSLHGCEFL